MWVFCCGMRRAGSTLQFQLAARIAEDEGIGKRTEWVRPEDFPRAREQYSGYQGLKIFKSHIYTPEIAAEFERHNALGVYVYRDIRDAFVSQMRKYKIGFGLMWVQNFLDSAMKNCDLWTQLPGMLISRYEDVMTDLPAEVGRIAAHLGVSYDDAKCSQLASEYTLERQKHRIAQASGTTLQHHQKASFDSRELLHQDHIRSGSTEQWKRELRPWQVALIEEKTAGWLTQHGYPLSAGNLSRADEARMHLCRLASKIVKTVYYRNRTR